MHQQSFFISQLHGHFMDCCTFLCTCTDTENILYKQKQSLFEKSNCCNRQKSLYKFMSATLYSSPYTCVLQWCCLPAGVWYMYWKPGVEYCGRLYLHRLPHSASACPRCQRPSSRPEPPWHSQQVVQVARICTSLPAQPMSWLVLRTFMTSCSNRRNPKQCAHSKQFGSCYEPLKPP